MSKKRQLLYHTQKSRKCSNIYKTSPRSATYVCWQRGTARIRPPLLQQSIDISWKPAAAGLLLRAHAGTDRRTDTVPFHRPCSAYYAGNASDQSMTKSHAQTENHLPHQTEQSLSNITGGQMQNFLCKQIPDTIRQRNRCGNYTNHVTET